MGLFDDITRSASQIAVKVVQTAGSAMKSAVSKSSDFAEISKLKMKVTAEQKSIDDLYYQIGRLIYQDCVEDGIVPECVQDQCSSVYQHQARITELQGKIELIRSQSGVVDERDESEVTFDDEEEVVVEELSPVSSFQEEETREVEAEPQYGVLSDLDPTEKEGE